MKKTCILILIFYICTKLDAQSTFNGLIGGCRDDSGQDITILSDGTKYVLSHTSSFDNTLTYMLITKFNRNNRPIWSKCLSKDAGYAYSIKGYKQDIIVAGNFIMRVDTSGQIKWSRKFESFTAFSIDISSDEEILLAGTLYPNGSGAGNKISVLKMDSIGNTRWAREFYSENESEGQGVIKTRDNAILVTGTLGWKSGKPFLVKLDNAGNIIWKNYYLFNNKPWDFEKIFFQKGSVIESAIDGNYMLTGTTRHGDPVDFSTYLLKINSSNGVVIWNKIYDYGANDYGGGIIEANSNFYLYGDATYTDTISGNTNWSRNMVVININEKGNVKWAKTYGCLNDDEIRKISLLNDTLYVIGTSDNFYGVLVSVTKRDSYYSSINLSGLGPNLLNPATLVIEDTVTSVNAFSDFESDTIKVTSQPVILSTMPVDAILTNSTCDPLGINNYIKSKLSAFPNPNEGVFTINFTEPNSDITIYNILGQVVYKNKSKDLMLDINISTLGNGLYLLNVKKDKYSNSIKIIKQ